MSTVNAVEVIAEALAKHHAVGMGICNCGWSTETKLGHSWREKHEAHQASVIAALPNIAVVVLPKPEPDNTVHPYWAVKDVSGLQVVRTTDADGSVEGDWVNIEFTARWRTVDRETAQAIGVALLAAVRDAGGES